MGHGDHLHLVVENAINDLKRKTPHEVKVMLAIAHRELIGAGFDELESTIEFAIEMVCRLLTLFCIPAKCFSEVRFSRRSV